VDLGFGAHHVQQRRACEHPRGDERDDELAQSHGQRAQRCSRDHENRDLVECLAEHHSSYGPGGCRDHLDDRPPAHRPAGDAETSALRLRFAALRSSPFDRWFVTASM
jgi:hypothetical protein